MGRIIVPRVQMGVTLGHRPGVKLTPRKGDGGFGDFLKSPLGLPVLKGALDAGIGIGGQLWGWGEGAAEEAAQEKAQADYNKRLKERTAALQSAAEAELGEMEDMSAGPQAFMAERPFGRPGMAGYGAQAPSLLPEGAVRAPTRGRPILAGGPLAPEDFARLDTSQAAASSPSMELNVPEAYQGNPMDIALNAMNVARNARRMSEETSGARSAQVESDITTMLDNAQADLERARHLAVSTGDLQAQQAAMRGLATFAREPWMTGPLSRAMQAIQTTTTAPTTPGYTTMAQEILSRANMGTDMVMTPAEHATAMGSMPSPPPVPLEPLPLRYSTQFGLSPADPAVTAQQRQDVELRRAALNDAVGQEVLRRQAMRDIGPRPEAPPIRMAAILAAAPAARTARERAMLLKAAESSPDVTPTNWDDLTTNAHKKRAIGQVAKLFPKEPKPERPMSELDRLRADYLRQQTLTSRSLEDQRKASIKAAQDKADKGALRKARSVSGGSPDDQRVFGHLMNHRRDFQGFQEGTGRYSTDSIAASLNRRFGENRQYTPEEIQTVRERLWSSRTGPLSGATDADREDLAMGMLSTRRSGKKYGGIVKGIKASDKKAIDQALKGSKEERIAEKQETSLEFARNREQRSRSKFENELTRSERELAASRAAQGIPNPESKAGQAAFLNAYVAEQESILRKKRGDAPGPPASSGAVYNAPITDEDIKFVESARQKHGQQD